jgi:hypothetical protein
MILVLGYKNNYGGKKMNYSKFSNPMYNGKEGEPDYNRPPVHIPILDNLHDKDNNNIDRIPNEPEMAKVAGCTKLNVRALPDKQAEIICIIDCGHELMIEDICDGWAHVYTGSGIEGYVMVQFIQYEK